MKSVDKFGHYRGTYGRGASPGPPGPPGPPGVGFGFNAEGNFDLQNKILTNVKDPLREQDAVTHIYLVRKLKNCLYFDRETEKFTCKRQRIGDALPPQEEADLVNLSFLKNNTLNNLSRGEYFDARTKRIKGVGMPEESTDAVTLEYLSQKLKETIPLEAKEDKFSTGGRRLSNLGAALDKTDAVNLGYLTEKLEEKVNLSFLKDHTLNNLSRAEYFDARTKRIKGVGAPSETSDAVNLGYVTEKLKQTIHLDTKKNKFDAAGRRMGGLGGPREIDDGVTLRFLKAWGKIFAHFVDREITDAVINLRREINGLHKTKPSKEATEKLLNDIEGSYSSAGWRRAAHEAEETKELTDRELKEILEYLSRLSGIDKSVIDLIQKS